MVRKMNEICRDFPILDQIVNDERLVYLDNAATSQKPKEVIDAASNYFLKRQCKCSPWRSYFG